jgi:hypothetical protein
LRVPLNGKKVKDEDVFALATKWVEINLERGEFIIA